MYTINRIGRDKHWRQFDMTPILISAPQWLHRSCNAPTQFYKAGKRPSVKADLAIYITTYLMFLDSVWVYQ